MHPDTLINETLMTMRKFAYLIATLLLLAAPYSANSQAVVVVFSTYIGGSADDGFCGIQIATDSLGYIYTAGYTLSDDIPTEGSAYQPVRNGGYDIFVAKFDPHLKYLLAATYLGGSGDEQYPAIAINHLGQVIITGYTYSGDFPTSSGVLQPSFGGGASDAFVTILNADLSTRISSTYIGGSSVEGPYNKLGLQVSMSNEIYIAGTTNSGDFPTSPGAYRESPIGDADIFVSRLSTDLSTLVASTYIGGSGVEAFPNLTFDNSGDVVVGTSTGASDYPTTLGAYNRVHSGSYYNGAISKLDPGLSTLIASTFVGDVSTCGIAADGDGSFFVVGHSDDVNYPTSVTAYDRTHNGVNEAIITKLDNDLENLLASTFLSGTDNGQGVSNVVDIDANGNVYAGIITESSNMPTTPDALDRTHNGGGNDAHIVKFDNDLSTLHYASFIGGSGDDAPSSLELDPAGNPVMAGMTKSLDFWTSDNCFEPDYNGGSSDCFVAKFVFEVEGDSCCIGITGNVDGDPEEIVDIGDLTALIRYLFIPPTVPPDCMEEANIDGDEAGVVDIGDLTTLIDYLFISNTSPAVCQ